MPNDNIPFPQQPNQPYPVEPSPPPAILPGLQPPQPPPLLPDVNFPDTLDNLQPTKLLAWGMTTQTSLDFGRACSPVAAPYRSAPQQFWRRHTGKAMKVITAIGIISGTENPPMPGLSTASDENQGNDVLMTMDVSSFAPENFMEGVECRATVVRLYYEMQMMPDPTVDSFDMGTSPFTNIPASEHVLTPSDFNSLLNQASAVSGFQGPPVTF